MTAIKVSTGSGGNSQYTPDWTPAVVMDWTPTWAIENG